MRSWPLDRYLTGWVGALLSRANDGCRRSLPNDSPLLISALRTHDAQVSTKR
jgi:hypothetical protein